MTVRAVMRDGVEETLDAGYGSTVDEVVASLTRDAVTGSAVPLAGARLRTADGRMVAYEDVNALLEDES
jgi:hypothetical protein